MTDYADKTDAELDALAAERMGWERFEPKVGKWSVRRIYWRKPDKALVEQSKWSPATDANDRDEWAEWLKAQGCTVTQIVWPNGACLADVVKTEPQTYEDGGRGHHRPGVRSLGRAVLIAGLRATDE